MQVSWGVSRGLGDGRLARGERRIAAPGLLPPRPGQLVEGLFGYLEGPHRRGHPTVEHHLGDDLAYLLLGDADVEGSLDVTPY